MNVRVSGHLLGSKILNISNIFKKSSKEIIISSIRFILYTDHIEIQAMNEKVTAWEKIYDDLIIDLNGRNYFSFLVNADTFISFIKNKVEYIDIDIKDNNTLEFTYPKGSFSTSWIEDKYYPVFIEPIKNNLLTLKSSLFVPVLKRSFYFSGKNEFMPFIETALLKIKDGVISIITTDRFKIFKNSKNIDNVCDQDIMLSEMASSILYQYLSDDDIDVNISTDGVRTYIWFENIIISDINVEGNFPNCDFIFNSFEPNSVAELYKKDFISMLKSSCIIENKDILMKIGFNIIVESEDSAKRNKFKESIDTYHFEGNEFNIRLSKENAIACVNNIIGDEIRIEYCEKQKFIRFSNPKYNNELIVCSTYGV